MRFRKNFLQIAALKNDLRKLKGNRWIPTGKLFDTLHNQGLTVTTPQGSNEISQYSEMQTNYWIKMTSVHNSSGLKPQCQMTSVHNSSGLKPQCQMTFDHNRSSLEPQCQMTFEQNGSSLAPQCQQKFIKQLRHNTSIAWICYSYPYSNDEYFNGENQVVLKSSAVTTTDASNKRQQQPDSTSSTSTLATTVTANGNFDL
ncbi:hypothetical protein Tco_0749479 [Tanacetum coccineum]|uniref:Uncharacterized protein n=1 Tax=Tanacetum coccineum TaxID=301880 RepID=A0ABQ4Z1K7_9ASTR